MQPKEPEHNDPVTHYVSDSTVGYSIKYEIKQVDGEDVFSQIIISTPLN